MATAVASDSAVAQVATLIRTYTASQPISRRLIVSNGRTAGSIRPVRPITGSPRLSGDPANSLLNYCYSLAESEARVALLAVGLDPALGVLHLDAPNRDSCAADLQEAIRPDVDSYVLDLLESRVFARRDFHETRRGQVRIQPPLTHHLAATTTTWAEKLAPIAEHLAHTIARGAGLRPPPTPLTSRRRRQAHSRTGGPPASSTSPALHRRAATTAAPRSRPANADAATATPYRTPPECATNKPRRTPTAKSPAAIRPSAPRFDTASAIANARTGKHVVAPSRLAGSPATRANSAGFIQPKLAGRTPSDLARATGLSPGYCAHVRDGRRVPHPRHWAAFQLAD